MSGHNSEKDEPNNNNWRKSNQDEQQDNWRVVGKNKNKNRHFKDRKFPSDGPPPNPNKSFHNIPNQTQTIPPSSVNLSEILNESVEKITDFLINNIKELTKSDLSNEDIISLLTMISKACDNNLVYSKSYMLKCIMEHTFTVKLRAFLTSLATIEKPPKDAVLHVLNILENSMQLIPNTCKGFVEMLVKNLDLILPVFKGDWSDELDRVKTLKQDLERLANLFSKPKLEVTVTDDETVVQTPTRDIRHFDLKQFDSQDFTNPERSFIRKNVIKGSYNSVKEYLDIHFRLLREDFLSPIREDLCDYLNHRNKHMFNIKIHKDVRFLETRQEKDKLLTILQFKVSQKLLNLLRSGQHKRFMYGSLLLFSNDGFKTLFTGRVMGTNGLLEGQLDVEVYGNIDVFMGTFTMVECTVFYEPYFQVLSVIQKLQSVPMERYIVNADSNVSHPKYMEKLRYYNVPSSLNPSQRAAMHAALNKELVIIQGPPGTGKTFLGMELVKLLLQIKADVKLEGPILIVAYTNHALEQFLDGVRGYTDKIVRLGHGSLDIRSAAPEIEANRLMCERLELFIDNNYVFGNDFEDNDPYNRVHGGITVKEIEIYIRYLTVRRSHPHQNDFYEAYSNLPSNLKKWLEERRRLTSDYRFLKQQDDAVEHVRTFLNSKVLLHLGVLKWYENLISLCWLMCNDGTVLPEKNFPVDVDDGYIFAVLYIIFYELKRLNIVNDDTFNIEAFREFISGRGRQHLLEQHDFLSSKADFLEQCLNTDFGHTLDNLENYSDIFEIPCRTRWQIYQRLINDRKTYMRIRLLDMQERQLIEWERYLNMKELDNVKLLKKMDIVAMTTTHAAKMRSTLELIGCPIVVAEEAAEVLESHIISALTMNCQHLILLGDHQQLRPTTADYTIGQKYNLGISLFERLIKNNIECHTLNVQHRMRPEISSLICPLFYKELHNDRKVEEYPLVSGIKCPLYFIDHTEPEEPYGDSSKMNVYEAQFLIQLAIFLLNNNYKPEDITILAAYRGQMYEMKKQQSLCKNDGLQQVRVAVVDNFQGEENKIILLSLVRNNTEGSVGFLSTDNRVCVALSRAKHGLYIMGNMNLLCGSAEMWKSIRSSLEAQKAIGRYLPLKCKIHQQHETLVSKVTDFEKVPNGGCNQICDTNLECGHKCKMICHAFDRDHRLYNCKEKCELLLCDNPKHLCHKLCFEKCGFCNHSVERTLNCGHKKSMACYKDFTIEKCKVRKAVDPVCGHKDTIPCYQDEATYKCSVLVQRQLKCSHLNEVPCGQDLSENECQHEEKVTLKCGHVYLKKCNSNVDGVYCKEVIEKELGCKHKVNIECGQNVTDVECSEEIELVLPCGHLNIKCSDLNDKRTPSRCMQPCKRSMKYCAKPEEHGLCPLKCGDECQPCPKIITKTYPNCSHSEKIQCHNFWSQRCQTLCRKKRSCGHICYKRCSDNCGECEQITKKTAECGHELETKCGLKPAECKNKCNKELDCGHKCPKKCGEPCEKTCRKTEIIPECGHQIIVNCDVEISPDMCTTYVQKTLACGHKYPKKVHCNQQVECIELVQQDLPCGHKQKVRCQETEVICTNKCRKKIPECGHPCTNLCSQPCTPQTKCVFPCNRILECGHKCPKRCYQTCQESCECQQYPMLICGHRSLSPCQVVCDKKLACGHTCSNICSEPCTTKCEELCVKTLFCGHEYKVMCSCEILKCRKKCEKKLPCGHKSCTQLCGEPCDICTGQCGKVLDCGHKCMELCSKPCACSFKKSTDCDHYVRVKCDEVPSRKNCKQICHKRLECGHFCRQECCEECICFCIQPIYLEPGACRNGSYEESD